MESTKTDIITIATMVDGEARTTTLAIAEGTENEHASVIKLVRTYQQDIEEFGHVDFKSEMVSRPQGGGAEREYALLNEPQATLVLTYMRNSEIVRGFKKRLVKAFYELRQVAGPPSASDPILMLAQATQMLRQEQINMQEQVAALATRTGELDARTEGLEISASSLKHQTAHLHDRAFDLDDKTDRLGKETRSLGCKANKMEADIAGISDGLRLAQRQVRDIQSRPTPPLTLRAPSNPITVRIHNKGLTVRGWAKQNGFKYSSVRNVISGITSKQVIVKAMSRDGLLEDESGDLF